MSGNFFNTLVSKIPSGNTILGQNIYSLVRGGEEESGFIPWVRGFYCPYFVRQVRPEIFGQEIIFLFLAQYF